MTPKQRKRVIQAHRTPEFRERMRIDKLGKTFPKLQGAGNGMWKGDRAGYMAIHLWLRRQRGDPKKCEKCPLNDPERKYEWANIDHKYKRVVEDWLRLCTSCHRKYDATLK